MGALFVLVGPTPVEKESEVSKRNPGPSELTIFEPGVLPEILEGSKNAFSKPAWYDNLRPYYGLNTHRSKVVHEHRRRIWDQGFTTKGLSDHLPREKDVNSLGHSIENI